MVKTLMALVLVGAVLGGPEEPPSGLLPVQSGQSFLGKKQIRMLLIGTEVSHIPPGGNASAFLLFKPDGEVRIRLPKGQTGRGSWRIKGPGVLCMKNIGAKGDKNFCVRLRREGNRIHHYVPKTGKRLNVQPWIIVHPGPKADRVPSS